jgi:hypothetical protein
VGPDQRHLGGVARPAAQARRSHRFQQRPANRRAIVRRLLWNHGREDGDPTGGPRVILNVVAFAQPALAAAHSGAPAHHPAPVPAGPKWAFDQSKHARHVHDRDRVRRSASEIAHAALTRPMWLKACGKLPSSSPVSGLTSSARRPRSLANAAARSNTARARST